MSPLSVNATPERTLHATALSKHRTVCSLSISHSTNSGPYTVALNSPRLESSQRASLPDCTHALSDRAAGRSPHATRLRITRILQQRQNLALAHTLRALDARVQCLQLAVL
jgi:hypothetical protein